MLATTTLYLYYLAFRISEVDQMSNRTLWGLKWQKVNCLLWGDFIDLQKLLQHSLMKFYLKNYNIMDLT